MSDNTLRAALDATDVLPEDAPVTGAGGQMYEAGWRERRQAIDAALAASATAEDHPFKDEWAFQRTMPEPYPGNSVAGKPIAPTQPCFDCDVPFKDHALAASATGTLRAAQREVVREWFDEGHETGRMEYDVLLDRLAALAASATDEPPKHLAMDGMAEGLLNLLAEYDIYSPDDLEMAILSWKSRAASATDEDHP